jgi:glycosyltransferase involved in cell wall biosynthesis
MNRHARIAMLLRSASRMDSGVFDAARGLAFALARQPTFEVEIFAVEDEYTREDRALWSGLPVRPSRRLGPAKVSYAPTLAKNVRTYDPDIVHLHGLWTYTSLVARNQALKTAATVIISIHGMLTPWALRHNSLRKTVAFRLFERSCLNAAQCLHATSSHELAQLRDLGLKPPIAVVPLATDASFSNVAKKSQGPRTLLSLGRVHPVKGLDRLLHAWAKISARNLGWQLKIIGPSDPRYREGLIALCKRLCCSNVEFIGGLSGSDKEHAFREADIFVLPSLSENFALTVLEALAHGVPVMASTASPWAGLVDQGCGWWINPDVNTLADALHKAMQLSPNELREMGLRGRAWVDREFRWDGIGKKMGEVYRWLLHRGKRPDCVDII